MLLGLDCMEAAMLENVNFTWRGGARPAFCGTGQPVFSMGRGRAGTTRGFTIMDDCWNFEVAFNKVEAETSALRTLSHSVCFC